MFHGGCLQQPKDSPGMPSEEGGAEMEKGGGQVVIPAHVGR